MKKIISILILIISFNSFAQNEADFKDNIGLPNLTEVTTADTLLVVNNNKKVRSFITTSNLFSSISVPVTVNSITTTPPTAVPMYSTTDIKIDTGSGIRLQDENGIDEWRITILNGQIKLQKIN